jgi:FHA domain
MDESSASVPQLVVLSPDSCRGHRIELINDYLVVGRDPGCDVRLDDPHVSRTHAALQRRGTAVQVLDLGSSGGTFVNGYPATTARELRPGDLVAFATVKARFDAGSPVTDQTQAMPAHSGPARYSIGRQDGEIISNVGRDQYNAQIQQVVQQRDSFLRDIASTRTRARWLICVGFVMFVVGFGLFAAADLSFLKQIAHDITRSQQQLPPPPASPFGGDILGVPSGLLGWALAAIGTLLLIVGIVLHVIATARRRRVERELPLPVPWPEIGPQGG